MIDEGLNMLPQMGGEEKCLVPVCAREGIYSRLVEKKARYQRQLDEVIAAMKSMDEHPELAMMLELVNRAARN